MSQSNNDLHSQVEEVMESKIRPALARHKGGVEVDSIDNESGIVYVRMQGMCDGCPAAVMTVKGLMESVLKEIPGITAVEIAQ